jgi:phage tail-like protein
MADRSAINAPVRTNRFEVELEMPGGTVPGWRRVDLPSSQTRAAEYREGPDPEYDFPLWGRTEYSDLIMERGAKQSEMMLWDWREKVNQGKLDEARKKIAVKIFDSTGQNPLIRYEFTKAWPKEYDAPTLDAQAGAGLGTETLVITFDSFERTA